MKRPWGEERFLDNVWRIQQRALITVVLMTAATLSIAVWVWWRTGQADWNVLILQPTSTFYEAKLLDQLLSAVAWLKVSIRLFVVETVAVAVGVAVLMTSYAREVNQLIELTDQPPSPPADGIPPPHTTSASS